MKLLKIEISVFFTSAVFIYYDIKKKIVRISLVNVACHVMQ